MRTPSASVESSIHWVSKTNSEFRLVKTKPAELVLSLAVLAMGIGVAIGAANLSGAGGYARIGPNVAPAVIAGGLILLGGWLQPLARLLVQFWVL